jgi:hypothetical protein
MIRHLLGEGEFLMRNGNANLSLKGNGQSDHVQQHFSK